MLADILSIPIDHVIIAMIIGVTVGLFMTMTGVGGGVLIIPALQWGFGMPVVMAVGTASIIASLIKINAAFNHIRAQNVNWSSVKLVLIGAVPALFIATEVVVRAANSPEFRELTETLVQGCVVLTMVAALISLFLGRKSEAPSSKQDANVPRALSVGALSGSVLGTTGIGGGVILLPALKSILGCTVKQAVGSSIVIALVLSGVTAVRYSSGNQSDIAIGLLVVVGSFLGVKFGMKAVSRLSEKALVNMALGTISFSLVATLIL